MADQQLYDNFYYSMYNGELIDLVDLMNTPGFCVNYKNPNQFGNTPIKSAIISNRVDLAEILLNRGAKISIDHFFSVIIHKDKDRIPILKLFLDRNIFSLNQQLTIPGFLEIGIKTPLSIAAVFGNKEIVKFLLSRGAAVDQDAIKVTRVKGYEDIARILETLPMTKIIKASNEAVCSKGQYTFDPSIY